MKRIGFVLAWVAIGMSGAGGTSFGQSGESPPRVFPEWRADSGGACGVPGAVEELRVLVQTGRRDRAASPEFLDALETLADKYAGAGMDAVPSGRLPWRATFAGEAWPAGWKAVNESVWQFGTGEARQVRSGANERFVLFYGPGMEWSDYSVTFRCESDRWISPPGRSAAVLYFRFQGIEDNYSFWLDGGGDITLLSNEMSKQHRLLARVAMAPEIIRDGKPWTLTVRGNTIEVWHEGKRMLMATDSSHASGTVGLESVHIPMKFSNVEVRP